MPGMEHEDSETLLVVLLYNMHYHAVYARQWRCSYRRLVYLAGTRNGGYV